MTRWMAAVLCGALGACGTNAVSVGGSGAGGGTGSAADGGSGQGGGAGNVYDAGPACTGLCEQVEVCAAGASTTVEGTVYDPAGKVPLYNVAVYIPNSTLDPVTEGSSCERCQGGQLSGHPITSTLTDSSGHFVQQALVSLISAYTAFLLANEILQVSGVMAVLVTGLIMGRVIHNDFQDERGTFVDTFWGFNVYVAEALVFLLMGVTVTVDMFRDRWLAMIIGIAAILLARAIGVFGASPLISNLPGVDPLSPEFQRLLFLGGLRGAVVLALALSIPLELDYWWTIQSIAFGVVIFTLFVQAPLVDPLLRRSHLVGKENDRN